MGAAIRFDICKWPTKPRKARATIRRDMVSHWWSSKDLDHRNFSRDSSNVIRYPLPNVFNISTKDFKCRCQRLLERRGWPRCGEQGVWTVAASLHSSYTASHVREAQKPLTVHCGVGSLTNKQVGVLKGMIAGLAITVLLISVAILGVLDPFLLREHRFGIETRALVGHSCCRVFSDQYRHACSPPFLHSIGHRRGRTFNRNAYCSPSAINAAEYA